MERPKRNIRAPAKLDNGGDDAAVQKAMRASLVQRRLAQASLPQAPVFRPTAEQFKDPLAYISSIQAEGTAAGLVQIIPPAGWKPAFANPLSYKPQMTVPTRVQNVHRFTEGVAFHDGRTYPLEEYKAQADAFREKWLRDHPHIEAEAAAATAKATTPGGMAHDGSPDPSAMCAAMTREFWRLVATSAEPAVVEYASDLDTDVYGSGFAAGPGGGRHPWDLTALTRHPASLLRHIKGSIEGVTKPWIYYGMLFAAFCWHVEDHALSSANYLHAGAPKTWYGVPGGAAKARFERALRTAVPALFAEEPGLLYSLVTLLPPASLIEYGVPVCTALQTPGTFIVTFPNAYHAGFSHGFNAGEAVNFALPDWLPYGRASVEAYRLGRGRRPPIFAHHELLVDLITAELESPGPLDTLGRVTLLAEWEIAVREEILARQDLLTRGVATRGPVTTAALAAALGAPESGSGPTCATCGTLPFLATVRCKCPGQKVACLVNGCPESACACAMTTRTLDVRVPTTKLLEQATALAGMYGKPSGLATAAIAAAAAAAGVDAAGRERAAITAASAALVIAAKAIAREAAAAAAVAAQAAAVARAAAAAMSPRPLLVEETVMGNGADDDVGDDYSGNSDDGDDDDGGGGAGSARRAAAKGQSPVPAVPLTAPDDAVPGASTTLPLTSTDGVVLVGGAPFPAAAAPTAVVPSTLARLPAASPVPRPSGGDVTAPDGVNPATTASDRCRKAAQLRWEAVRSREEFRKPTAADGHVAVKYPCPGTDCTFWTFIRTSLVRHHRTAHPHEPLPLACYAPTGPRRATGLPPMNRKVTTKQTLSSRRVPHLTAEAAAEATASAAAAAGGAGPWPTPVVPPRPAIARPVTAPYRQASAAPHQSTVARPAAPRPVVVPPHPRPPAPMLPWSHEGWASVHPAPTPPQGPPLPRSFACAYPGCEFITAAPRDLGGHMESHRRRAVGAAVTPTPLVMATMLPPKEGGRFASGARLSHSPRPAPLVRLPLPPRTSPVSGGATPSEGGGAAAAAMPPRKPPRYQCQFEGCDYTSPNFHAIGEHTTAAHPAVWERVVAVKESKKAIAYGSRLYRCKFPECEFSHVSKVIVGGHMTGHRFHKPAYKRPRIGAAAEVGGAVATGRVTVLDDGEIVEDLGDGFVAAGVDDPAEPMAMAAFPAPCVTAPPGEAADVDSAMLVPPVDMMEGAGIEAA